jgi:carbamoyltransferase
LTQQSFAPVVLGISASHNGAACLMKGSEIVVAISEERLSRRKRHRIYGADPALCIRYCLETAGVTPSDLEMVVVAPQKRGWRAEHDPNLNPILRTCANSTRTGRISHHYAHALSAFGPSGATEAAILVCDGIGSSFDDLEPTEQAAIANPSPDAHEMISIYEATGQNVGCRWKQVVAGEGWLSRDAWDGMACRGMPTFGSLGGMYSAAAVQIFGDADDAGKVMGLAAYGRPDIPVSDFFTIENGVFRFHATVADAYRGVARGGQPEDHADLAASVQRALEEALLHLGQRIRTDMPQHRTLCFAGGSALNSVTNQRMLVELGFEDIFVLPAAEDSGVAIGAAIHGTWACRAQPNRRRFRVDALGAPYSVEEIDRVIADAPAVRSSVNDVEASIEQAADLLQDGAVVAWFTGGSEFGPRALGQRSILFDPTIADGKEILNHRVKHREAFRPFAASVLSEQADDWFDFQGTTADAPFMLRVIPVRPERAELIPAVMHPDMTCRIQTVSADLNAYYHRLITAFARRTGVPMVLNTSFNVMGEPIVETPEDALWALIATDIDALWIEGRLVERASGYQSILELIPAIEPDVVAIEHAVGERGLMPHAIRYDARTRWGEFSAFLPAKLVELIQAIDGETSLGELLERLELEPNRQTLKQIVEARRFRLLRFESSQKRSEPLPAATVTVAGGR